jgi:hypothetical protein
MSLMRAGRAAEAQALLARRPDSLPVNNAYTTRLKLYRGEIQPEQVFTPTDTAGVQVATLSYGLGNWYLVRGDTVNARRWFQRSVSASAGWPVWVHRLRNRARPESVAVRGAGRDRFSLAGQAGRPYGSLADQSFPCA